MLIVQKYGGSSLATADRIRHVAGRIARERAEGERLVVVVSAMGDTTDDLLALAAQITPDPDPRELDVLLATGEHMSGTLVAMALHALGIPAISLTGPQAGIRTDTRHGRARIANVDPARLVRELDAGRVVIVAGFQGATGEGFLESDVTTLGRGGSDTTAVALAARLGADRCEILTDVEGIFTADPRVVPEARLLPVIGYEEMLELAQQGAQVMQTRAVELGWVNGVVIAVRSTFSDHPGTRIREDPLVEQRNKVRGLATDRHVAKVTLVGVPDRPGVAHAVFAPLAEAGINVDMIVQNVGHAGTTDLSFTIPSVDLARAEPAARGDPPRARRRGGDHRPRGRQGLHRRGRHPERPRLRGADVRHAGRRRHQHRDDLDQRDPHHLHHRRGRRGGRRPGPPPRLRPGAARDGRPGAPGRGRRGRRRVSGTRPFVSRLERLAEVDSTQRVVAGWLADGVAEVAVATADVQTAGRGRTGRTWQAPPGAALLMTCGFRPRGLPLAQAWRIAAVASLALAEAAEAQGLPGRHDRPEVAQRPRRRRPERRAAQAGRRAWRGRPRRPTGRSPPASSGWAINVDWPAAAFPPELAPTMTSLRELAHRPVDRDAVLEGFLDRLEPRYEALMTGRFDSAGWTGRQRTTGRRVTLQAGDEVVEGIGAGVDPLSGALAVDVGGTIRHFDSAEVLRCRITAAGRL